MKHAQWWLLGLVVVGGVVGGGVAMVAPTLRPSSTGSDSTAATDQRTAASTNGTSTATQSASQPHEDRTAQPDPRLSDFPHRQIEVVDQVKPGSDFAQFRDRMQQAVKTHDANFLRSIIPPDGLPFGFGGPLDPADMALDNPQGWFWQTMEKITLLKSCELNDYAPSGQIEQGEVWVCPNVTNAFYRQYPVPENAEGIEYEISQVVVIGQGVNVRAAPNTHSPVVGILTNEVVELDQPALDALYEKNPEVVDDAIAGWTPVILPNQVRGYVSKRYTYQPLEPRAVFERVNGQWQMTYIMAGD